MQYLVTTTDPEIGQRTGYVFNVKQAKDFARNMGARCFVLAPPLSTGRHSRHYIRSDGYAGGFRKVSVREHADFILSLQEKGDDVVNAAEEQAMRDEINAAREDEGDGRIPQVVTERAWLDLQEAVSLASKGARGLRHAHLMDPHDSRIQDATKQISIARAILGGVLSDLDNAGF